MAVVQGEKTAEEALSDTVKDSGQGAVTGYVMSGGLTFIGHQLSNSSSLFIRNLAASNVPGKVITAVMMTGDVLVRYGQGEITTQECILALGERGINFAASGYGAIIGQALIPIPIVGGAIGMMIGSVLADEYSSSIIQVLKTKQLEHEERLRLIAEYNRAAEEQRIFRAQLEEYLNNYLQECREFFEQSLSELHTAYEMDDYGAVADAANRVTRALGGKVDYETHKEFRAFLRSDEKDIL